MKDLASVEAALLDLVAGVKFCKYTNSFQNKLGVDRKYFNSSDKKLVFSDKTNNIYKLNSGFHDKLLTDAITSK